MVATPVSRTIILSSASITPWEIMAPFGEEWPTDAYAHTVFSNTAGGMLADVEPETILPDTIRYIFRPDGDQSTADVPAGARFESFIETDDGTVKLSYGVVQRAEARFRLGPPPSTPPGPRLFADGFLRSAAGFKWEPVYGKTKIFTDNTLAKNPIGLGPDTNKLLGKPAAVRYYQPLSGDSPEVSLVIQMPGLFGAANGKTRAIFAADQNQRVGLAIECDSVNHQVHMARVTAPDTLVYVGSAASGITFVDGDIFTARYNNLTDTLAVYRGASTSPMVAPWPDTTHLSPHGNGYRYLHLAWDPNLLETGPLVSGWSAKDGV